MLFNYCPNCGGELEHVVNTIYPENTSHVCHKCGWVYDSKEEAIRLLFDTQYKDNFMNIPDACRLCSNHPSNGGSGICHCILGLSTVY